MIKEAFLLLLASTALSYAEPLLLWKAKTAGSIYSSPVISNNMVYFGSNDSCFYAINADNGSIKWKFRTKGEIRSKVSFNEGFLYLNGGDGSLYSLDKESGKLLWSFSSGGEKLYPLYSYADYFHSSPLYSNNLVYFASGDSCLYSLNSRNGKLVWKFKTNDIIHSSPIIYGDKLYVGSFDGHVYCLDPADGKMEWKFKTVGQRFFPKGEVQGNITAGCGLIFVGARDYNLYAIDAVEGYCHWNRQFPKGWALALTAKDSVLYTGTSDDDMILALECLTGKEIWSTDVNFNIFGSPLPVDSSLYFGTLKGKFYKLNILTGNISWTFNTQGYESFKGKYFDNKEVIDKNNFYSIVGTPEGYIKALNELGAIFTKPVILKDRIIFTSTDGYIYCVIEE